MTTKAKKDAPAKVADPGMKLYEATEALAIVDELLMESGGELTPEIQELLEKAEGDFETKAVRVALKIKELRAAADICTSHARAIENGEPKRLKARARSFEASAAGLEKYLDEQMALAGRKLHAKAPGAKPIKHDLVTIQYDKLADKLDVATSCNLEALAEAEFPFVTPELTFKLDTEALAAECKAAIAKNEVPQLPQGIAYLTDRITLRIK